MSTQRATVQPTATPDKHDPRRVRFDHPAYGAIRASRVSGSQVLTGSDFIHHNYLIVEISTASITRDLAHDWFHGDLDSIVRVAMSEAQWATFVSSLNMGSGVPCTLEIVGRERIPDLPEPVGRTEQFSAEAVAYVQAVIDRVIELEKIVADGKIPTKLKDQIALELNIIRSHLHANVPYVGKAFTEHVERVTEHAKIEINAHVQAVVQRAGLSAIAGGKAPFTLPGDIDGER